MRLFLLLLSYFVMVELPAQSNLLVLKKKEQTLQTWSSGSYIIFRFTDRQWIEGFVRKVQNDSIWLNQVQINRVFNNWGFYSFDTSQLGIMKFHVNEISAVPRKDFSNNIFTNGKLFQLGSMAFIFLNVLNSAIHQEPVFADENLPRLGAASAVFLIGTIMARSRNTYWEVGKKYQFKTLQLGIDSSGRSATEKSNPSLQ
jgi:hypothetical protein